MYRNVDNWTLHVDVYGSDDRFEVFVEVPGVSRDDIELEVTPLVLKVRGVKKSPSRGITALAIEIQTGGFQREIHLPSRVNTTNAVAELKSGVLHVTLIRQKPVRVSIPVQPGENSNF